MSLLHFTPMISTPIKLKGLVNIYAFSFPTAVGLQQPQANKID